MLYFDCKAREAFIFVDSELPVEGWLQKCIYCETITSNYCPYKNLYGTNIYVFKCKICKLNIPEYKKKQFDKWVLNEYEHNKGKFIY